MTEVSNLLPEWLVRSKGPAGTAAETGSPPRGLADAWRREMERQQQQAWFLPIPPVHTMLPWANEHALPTTASQRAPLGAAELSPFDPSPSSMTLTSGSSNLGSEWTAGAEDSLRLGHHATVKSGADSPATTLGSEPPNSPHAESVASGEQRSQGSNRPEASGALAGGAVATASVDGLLTSVDPNVATADAGLGIMPLEAARQPSPLLPAQEPSTAALGLLQDNGLRVPQQTLPMGRDGAWLVPPKVQQQIEGLSVAGEAPEPAAVAAATHPAAGPANQAQEPPMRVHCGWQNGQLTVWIGHDRGHAESAAMLVQAIDRWLAEQRLSSAGYVINGKPVLRESAVRGTARTREAEEAVQAADDILDNMLDGAAQFGFRRVVPYSVTSTSTSRENT